MFEIDGVFASDVSSSSRALLVLVALFDSCCVTVEPETSVDCCFVEFKILVPVYVVGELI